MSFAQALMMGYSNPLIAVDSAQFDGTNDYMDRGAGLTGAADSKSGIISLWWRKDGDAAGGNQYFMEGGISITFLHGLGTTSPHLILTNSSGTTILDMNTSSTFGISATWRHLLFSWDLSTAGASNIYVNDVSNKTVNTFTNDVIDYTTTDLSIGAQISGNARMQACLAEFYFAPGQYLDFSLVANRRKFISASGKPVHLGTTGVLPTGTAPIIYQHMDVGEAPANFATNRGTGGNFSIIGTLTTGSTSPST